MNPLKCVKYSKFEDLKLHVYVVGYPSKGESILLILAENEKPLISIVTDCFELSGYNHVSEILNSWGMPDIELFVWTHPHEDHSVGIKKFFEKHDKNSVSHIMMPDNFVDANNNHQYKEAATDSYEYLQSKYNSNKVYNYHPVHYDSFSDCVFKYRLEKAGNNKEAYNLEITILGPIAGLTARNADNHKNDNKFSIVYKLSVNGLNLFMGGDMDKSSLSLIDEDHFKEIHFVKIPHHASRNIKDLAKKFGQNMAPQRNAVSTVYSSGNLPDEEVLNDYCSVMDEVDCTGPKKDTNPDNNYGCVHLIYDVAHARRLEIFKDGNAYEHKSFPAV